MQMAPSTHPHCSCCVVHLYCLLAHNAELFKGIRVLWVRNVADVLQPKKKEGGGRGGPKQARGGWEQGPVGVAQLR